VLQQLIGEASGHRLTSGLAALAVTDKQRPPPSVEVEVTPFERAELGAAQPGRDESEQHEPVALGEAGQVPLGMTSSVEQAPELLLRQPVALLPRLRRRLEVNEWVADAFTLAHPPEEPAQEEKAPVVGRLRRARALLVRAQVVDDRRLLEDVPPARFRPLEQVVDRDPVRHDRALALLLGFEPTQPVVARLPK